MRSTLTRFIAFVAIVIAPAANVASAQADSPSLQIDLSPPGVYELLEPLRMSCMRAAIAKGASEDDARRMLPACLTKRLLSAVELERSIRVLYPGTVTQENLVDCIKTVDEDRALLPCVQGKRLEQ